MASAPDRPPLRRSAILASVAAVVLAVVGIALVIWGWPMTSPTHVAAVRWAMVPITLSVLAPVTQMAAVRQVWRRGVAWLYATLAVAFLAGFVWMVVSIASGGDSLLPAALAWTGLGIAFVHLAGIAVAQEVRTVRWEQEQLDTDDGLSDEPAVPVEVLRGEDAPDDHRTETDQERP